jgi:hypothetical protein
VPKPGKTTRRGYGWKHQQRRKVWERVVAAGEAYCSRCGRGIYPDEPWDLDHTDDRSSYNGPAHVRCNRATAGPPQWRRTRGGFPPTRTVEREPRRNGWYSPDGRRGPHSRQWDDELVFYVDGEAVPKGRTEPELPPETALEERLDPPRRQSRRW